MEHLNEEPFGRGFFFVGPSNINDLELIDAQTQLMAQTSGEKISSNDSKNDPNDVGTHINQPPSQPPSLVEYASEWVAIGAIRLHLLDTEDGEIAWAMTGAGVSESFPNKLLSLAEKRHLLRTERLPHTTILNMAILRVYVLPEDVSRSHRGSVMDIRRIIKYLIKFLDTSNKTWHGRNSPDSRIRTYNVPKAAQVESLFYIFNTLSSPEACESLISSSPYCQQSLSDILHDTIPGMKTELYPYQKRSVAAMLQREADPAMMSDPRKPLYRDLENRPFYLDTFDGILLRNEQRYAEPQGGILAETMGYGKTLICIALILATKGHYPKVPEGRLENSARKLHQRTPSLLTMAARALKHHAVPWKAEFEAFRRSGYHFDRCVEELAKYEREFAEPLFTPTTPDRKVSKRESARLLRLCSATLVVVPPNLLVQWQHEIEKHTESNALDLLVVDASTKQIPHWKELMSYDVVLMTKARFEQDYRDDDLNQGRRMRGEDRFHSSLTDVRWLRVICDEGHGFAGSASRTNAMAMLDKMSIERRWVVSGTPSSSLHGIEVNLATSENQATARRDSFGAALEHRRVSDAADQEVKDMDRLKLIVVNFLKLQPWANQKGHDHADWKKYLAPFDSSGNRRFAPGLRILLQNIIVRHRIEDIDLDLCLPPLYNTTVYLEPSYHDKLSMNLFTLVLTSNAITSERTDEDYMHHIKNRKRLDQLINNLRQSSFHWIGFTQHDISETLRVSNTYLNENLDKISDHDAVLLTEAIMNGDRALGDPGWRAFSALHEIGVYLDSFPDHAADAWSIHGQTMSPLLLGTVQAREVQQHILAHTTDYDPAAGLASAGLKAMRAARDRAADEQRDKTANKVKAGTSEEPKVKNQTSPSRTSLAKASSTPTKKRPQPKGHLPESSPLLKTQIVGFSSAKLTYLIDQVLLHQETEKTIIFYDANNIAFWIAEALELLSIPFLIYANTLSVPRRATYLATFNQSPAFRVLLMDLKQAAHGLHVAAASRVYIVSPIWQPNIESQAIKRAHRIGQTKPVYVETLVLRGTLEEKMLARRKQMSNLELQRAEKSLLDDRTMAEIIKEERFLKFMPGEDEEEGKKVAWLREPRPLFWKAPEVDEGNDDEHGDSDKKLIMAAGDMPSASKRRKETKGEGKRVGFALDSIASKPDSLQERHGEAGTSRTIERSVRFQI